MLLVAYHGCVIDAWKLGDNILLVTTANKVTIFRILLVPFFAIQLLLYFRNGIEWHRMVALFTFILATVSDGVDGFIARRYNQKSELGAILDPLADKLLLVTGIILLSTHHRDGISKIPGWLTLTIICRDAILSIGLIVLYYTRGKVAVRPGWIGKAATILQMALVIWILALWNEGPLSGLFIGCAVCTVVSGVIHFIDGIQKSGDRNVTSV